MKLCKLFLPLFLLMGIASCNNNNDEDLNGPKVESHIVGKWEVESININGEIQNLNACETQSIVEFFTNGTAQFTFSSGSGNCVIETSNEKWKHLGGDLYELIEVEDNEEYEVIIKFSHNYDNLTITEENSDGVIIIEYLRI